MHIVAVGGSDAGISAALRAREVNPDAEFTVVVADAYPNFSICGTAKDPARRGRQRCHLCPPVRHPATRRHHAGSSRIGRLLVT